MGIEIIYKDTTTNTDIRKVSLSDGEVKALKTDIIDVAEWHENAIKQKARRMIDSVAEQALRPGSNLLSEADRSVVHNKLMETGQFITHVRDLPDDIKHEIVKRAKVTEAQAEPPSLKK